MLVRGVLLSLAVLAFFWGLALMVALDDVDFFSLSDLRDLSEPHHEHIVVALGLFGLVAAAVTLIVSVILQPTRR